MLNIPYTDLIHTKTLIDEYNLLEKKRSIIGYIIKKFCTYNIKSYIKILHQNLDSDVILDKKDFMNFGMFLVCIDNNSRDDKLCTIESSDYGNRYRIFFKEKEDTKYIIDTMENKSSSLELTLDNSIVHNTTKIHGDCAKFINKCIINTICNYIAI